MHLLFSYEPKETEEYGGRFYCLNCGNDFILENISIADILAFLEGRLEENKQENKQKEIYEKERS